MRLFGGVSWIRYGSGVNNVRGHPFHWGHLVWAVLLTGLWPGAGALAVEPAVTGPASNTPVELLPIESAAFNRVLVSESASLPARRQIFVAPAATEFAPVWLERFGGETSAGFRSTVLTNYGAAFTQSLQQALADAGWTIAPRGAPDAITLRPRLFDIYILAPNAGVGKETLVAIAGQAGMELTFEDLQGRTFLQLEDHRYTRSPDTGAILANRSTNFYYFKQLMQDWSQTSASYLNGVMQAVGGATAPD